MPNVIGGKPNVWLSEYNIIATCFCSEMFRAGEGRA